MRCWSSAGAGAAATFDANAVAEPRYTGLLSRAPAAVGDVEDIIDRFGEYREQLSDLVGNVVTLYLAAEDLPAFAPDDDTIRVLHVSDIHLNPQAFDLMDQLTEQFDVDAIADTGDIVDWGTEPESQLLGQIGDLEVPYIFVRGNHDSRSTQRAVADQPNAVVLDGDAAEVAGLRFWGIGDPRYTPDKDQMGPSEQERAEAFAPEVADDLAAAEPPDVDVVLVHDARIAADIGGEVPLVLAGHTHEPSDEGSRTGRRGRGVRRHRHDRGAAPRHPAAGGGLHGGAGLRGLQGDEPKPLRASVLLLRSRHPRAARLRPDQRAGGWGNGCHHRPPHPRPRRRGRRARRLRNLPQDWLLRPPEPRQESEDRSGGQPPGPRAQRPPGFLDRQDHEELATASPAMVAPPAVP